MTRDEEMSLQRFLAAVRAHYGTRLHEIVLFGSRARGDARADSDADIALVLADGGWGFWQEKRRLAELAYDALIDSGLSIQPWPVARSAWEDPASHHNAHFVEAIRRDGRRLSPLQ